ncbi:GNAT family N-acetyltransferase [Bowmanella pacifica]|uniref:GCN5 family N-acetyltransferase n=1 Tax=Bowmanella pacifica TaxID=502051 RepID=A0A918DL77_9ALTE|nr:GNAT family N-acetyltransferase [Bowmanella pacifica]GGO73018.1 GCN5 family N-acetyltransferase [Bowmanella pacifica]
MAIKIRRYRPEDAKALTDIFYAAVHGPALEYYSQAQADAWAPMPKNYAAWQARFDCHPPFVALQGDKLVGFMTLEPDGHIDVAYSHPAHQRQGIATALYHHLQAQALTLHLPMLYVEASYLARPFFAKQGFSLVRENQVERGGQILVNFSMQKRLKYN